MSFTVVLVGGFACVRAFGGQYVTKGIVAVAGRDFVAVGDGEQLVKGVVSVIDRLTIGIDVLDFAF
ncbi:hypothetical protein [Faucicola mancuniensis]|uniref:hypothetical protein n=1 Tax=Faucicola mancuniensis TaxID=1309795 RepID=UPI0039774242